MDISETMEDWVERKKQEPIGRETVTQFDSLGGEDKERKAIKKAVFTQLSDTFSKDIFSLPWVTMPREATIVFHHDLVQRVDTALLHARVEITRKMPPKTQLWRVLKILYEEAKHQQATICDLRERVIELESMLEI